MRRTASAHARGGVPRCVSRGRGSTGSWPAETDAPRAPPQQRTRHLVFPRSQEAAGNPCWRPLARRRTGALCRKELGSRPIARGSRAWTEPAGRAPLSGLSGCGANDQPPRRSLCAAASAPAGSGVCPAGDLELLPISEFLHTSNLAPHAPRWQQRQDRSQARPLS